MRSFLQERTSQGGFSELTLNFPTFLRGTSGGYDCAAKKSGKQDDKNRDFLQVFRTTNVLSN